MLLAVLNCHYFCSFKVKTLLQDKQAEVHQAIVKELDRYENECMPDATISSSSVVFDKVRYLEPKKTTITIKNTKQFPARYRFKPKLQDERFCKPWLWANPPVGMIMPGECFCCVVEGERFILTGSWY